MFHIQSASSKEELSRVRTIGVSQSDIAVHQATCSCLLNSWASTSRKCPPLSSSEQRICSCIVLMSVSILWRKWRCILARTWVCSFRRMPSSYCSRFNASDNIENWSLQERVRGVPKEGGKEEGRKRGSKGGREGGSKGGRESGSERERERKRG